MPSDLPPDSTWDELRETFDDEKDVKLVIDLTMHLFNSLTSRTWAYEAFYLNDAILGVHFTKLPHMTLDNLRHMRDLNDRVRRVLCDFRKKRVTVLARRAASPDGDVEAFEIVPKSEWMPLYAHPDWAEVGMDDDDHKEDRERTIRIAHQVLNARRRMPTVRLLIDPVRRADTLSRKRQTRAEASESESLAAESEADAVGFTLAFTNMPPVPVDFLKHLDSTFAGWLSSVIFDVQKGFLALMVRSTRVDAPTALAKLRTFSDVPRKLRRAIERDEANRARGLLTVGSKRTR